MRRALAAGAVIAASFAVPAMAAAQTVPPDDDAVADELDIADDDDDDNTGLWGLLGLVGLLGLAGLAGRRREVNDRDAVYRGTVAADTTPRGASPPTDR